MPAASQNPATLGSQTEFSAVLSAAITHRNLTLERIAQHLRESGAPVSIATLSYWQTGRSLPTRTRSLVVLQELEKVLRVPAGHLTGALPQTVAPSLDPVTSRPRSPRISDALTRMGFRTDPDFANQTLQDSIDFSLDEATQSETTRQLLRAEVAELDRIPLVLRQDEESLGMPTVEPLVGCHLGEMVRMDDGVVIAELKLSHSLPRGELAMVEYRVIWDVADEEDFGFARVLPKTVGHLVIDVQFLDRLPRAVTYTMIPGSENERRTPASQPVDPTAFVQLAIANPTPGVHQLGWEF